MAKTCDGCGTTVGTVHPIASGQELCSQCYRQITGSEPNDAARTPPGPVNLRSGMDPVVLRARYLGALVWLCRLGGSTMIASCLAGFAHGLSERSMGWWGTIVTAAVLGLGASTVAIGELMRELMRSRY